MARPRPCVPGPWSSVAMPAAKASIRPKPTRRMRRRSGGMPSIRCTIGPLRVRVIGVRVDRVSTLGWTRSSTRAPMTAGRRERSLPAMIQTTSEPAAGAAGETEPGLAIAVRGLRKAYGEHEAVAGIDLEVRRGEIVAFLGPNGAGKTTTVEILEGFRSRDAGEVSVLGADPASGNPGWRERIGIVLQQA